jgi:hypothetical protein
MFNCHPTIKTITVQHFTRSTHSIVCIENQIYALSLKKKKKQENTKSFVQTDNTVGDLLRCFTISSAAASFAIEKKEKANNHSLNSSRIVDIITPYHCRHLSGVSLPIAVDWP